MVRTRPRVRYLSRSKLVIPELLANVRPPPQPSCPNKVAFNKPVKTLWKTEELNAERTIMQVRAADGPGIHNQRLLPWDNHVLHASNSLHPRQTATPPKERRDPFAMPLQN